ncbi:ALKBH4 [Mytilus coruscus]|uniref:ALKBH4 n=1 Tax=Mytilus coruscus TaxID=42192 RepID=A0A6J8EKK5_MYTCO|nr:ALKBH4 [Mytilus coruscus]
MEKTCGCKGIRSCILCEKQEKPTKQQNCQKSDCVDIYDFCCHCGKAWLQSSQKSDIDEGKLSNCEIIATPQCCESHDEQGTRKFIHFPGIHIYCDFISETEERRVCDKIYETPFCLSQSGRRKQDYGPKVNFKKKKLKLAEFTGLQNLAKTYMTE